MAYVYRHIRLDKNVPFYIGIGNDNTYYRANFKFGRNATWKNIVNKTSYHVEILIDNVPLELALKKEIEFIKLYGRKDLGTGTLANMTEGGEGTVGLIITEETREKLKNRPKLSQEARLEISRKLTGRKIPQEIVDKISKSNKGRKISAEKVAKRREKRVYSPLSIETKEKIRQFNLGKKASKETKKKLSEILKGNKRAVGNTIWVGRKHTEETKAKMSISAKERKREPYSEESKEKMRISAKKRWAKKVLK